MASIMGCRGKSDMLGVALVRADHVFGVCRDGDDEAVTGLATPPDSLDRAVVMRIVGIDERDQDTRIEDYRSHSSRSSLR